MRGTAARWFGAVAAVVVASIVAGPPAAAQPVDPDEDAYDAAVYLLERAVTPRRDGTHHRLLRALRHLQDPGLAPLYAHLAGSDDAGLRVHGILGLGEVSPERRIDLQHLMTVDAPAMQAELVSSALDDELISAEDCARVASWRGLDDGVKLVVAMRMVRDGGLEDAGFLRSTLADADALPGRRAMAAALLHQLGDPSGLAYLRSLSASDAAERDPLEVSVLRAAIHHGFDRLGPWAIDVALAAEPASPRRTAAMRVALRFGADGALPLWRSEYRNAGEPVQRLRLAIMLLQLSPHLEPEAFDALAASEEPLLAQVGVAGRAIASGDAAAVDRVYELLQYRQGVVYAWAIYHAVEHARPDEGQVILLSLLQATAEAEGDAEMSVLLGHAAQATRALYELDPPVATRLLRPYLSSPEVDPAVAQAVLLGLVRSTEPGAGAVIADLPPMPHPDTAALQVLLRAKSGLPLDRRQARTLTTIVRGGGAMRDALRIQAAWALLRRMDRASAALERVTAG